MAATPSGFKVLDGTRQIDLDELLVDRDIFNEGNLWAWGLNTNGQLATNDVTPRSSPVQTVAGGTNWKQVVAGGLATNAGIKTDGTLWLWGGNSYGGLGDNTITQRSSPVQTIAGGNTWKQVAVGQYECAAIKTDGTLWVWGANNYGQLGTNNTTNVSSPIQTVAGGTNWKQVAVGTDCMAAIKTDGTLWLWGQNTNGQLGTNNITPQSSPVQTVAGGTNWKLVCGGSQNMAAIKTDGTLWLWGAGVYGQMGDGTAIRKSSPVQTIAGGTNWKYVDIGARHVMAIKTDGTLWGWGGNTWGMIATNDQADRSSPVQTIAGGTNWKRLAVGLYHTLAIKADGTLWGWGQNSNGQLGTNETAILYRSSPVQTVAGGTTWKDVSAGQSNGWTVAVKYNGPV